jgi:photosystem II stability/assembly factor-like uncharacterized protein
LSQQLRRRTGSSVAHPSSKWQVWIRPVGALAAVALVGLLVLLGKSAPNQAAWATLGTKDVHSLSFVDDDPHHLLFGHHGGILESRDGGRTWTALPVRDDAMSMAPAQDGSIVIAGHNVFTASRDGGLTWSVISADLPSLDIHGFTRDPVDPARMWAYLATGGLWESTDSGVHWTRVREDDVVFPLAILRAGATRLLGVDYTGLVASDDGGRTWASVGSPPTYPMTALAATPDGATIYAGSPDGLFRSADGGATWRKTTFAGAPFAIATATDGMTVALVDQSTDFFRSADGGETWPQPSS